MSSHLFSGESIYANTQVLEGGTIKVVNTDVGPVSKPVTMLPPLLGVGLFAKRRSRKRA